MDLLDPPLQALIMMRSSMTLSLILQQTISAMQSSRAEVEVAVKRCAKHTDLDAGLAVAELPKGNRRRLAAEALTDSVDQLRVRGAGEDARLSHGGRQADGWKGGTRSGGLEGYEGSEGGKVDDLVRGIGRRGEGRVCDIVQDMKGSRGRAMEKVDTGAGGSCSAKASLAESRFAQPRIFGALELLRQLGSARELLDSPPIARDMLLLQI
nr:hypothetical protein CFP56_16875 [Quercus suber]